MRDTILAVVGIVAIFIGLPLLILWFRDRSRAFGGVVQRILGALSLMMGLVILGWFVYNQFVLTEEFKLNYRRLFQLAGPIVMLSVGWKWLLDVGPGLEKQDIDFNSPEMHAASAEARRTLPYFIAEVNRHVDGAYIKFPFTTDQGVIEHIWAYVHHHEEECFNVSIANVPYTQKGRFETRRDVAEKDVEDWQIMLPNGRIKGAYSFVGAFRYLQSKRQRLNRTLRKQRAQLIDA